MRDLTKYFRALTSVSRLRIMEQLATAQGELTVGELAVRLGMSQPLVSWHLRDLRRINLVQMRRAGRQALCSLNRGRLTYYQTLFTQLTREHK
jgi:DNA-binding transcriptional ArsR family regulator